MVHQMIFSIFIKQWSLSYEIKRPPGRYLHLPGGNNHYCSLTSSIVPYTSFVSAS